MLGLLVAVAAILHAQTPDSAARVHQLAALQALDDSLTGVSAAAAGFRADLATASPDLIVSRAGRLQRRCIAADGEGQRLAKLDSLDPRFRRELAALRSALGRCIADFTTGPGRNPLDSIAAWAPYRLARLDDAIRRYRTVAHGLKWQLEPHRSSSRG